MIHDYVGVSLEVVWRTVKENIPSLRFKLVDMLVKVQTESDIGDLCPAFEEHRPAGKLCRHQHGLEQCRARGRLEENRHRNRVQLNLFK